MFKDGVSFYRPSKCGPSLGPVDSGNPEDREQASRALSQRAVASIPQSSGTTAFHFGLCSAYPLLRRTYGELNLVSQAKYKWFQGLWVWSIVVPELPRLEGDVPTRKATVGTTLLVLTVTVLDFIFTDSFPGSQDQA